jgi:glucose/arabinose dehydrogenase
MGVEGRMMFRIPSHRVPACVLILLLIGAGLAQASGTTTKRVASGLFRPIYVAAPRGDTDRLFIAEQHTGRIKILNLNTGLVNSTPFLDIDGLATGNEQGLLGLAFHPGYSTNGFIYVNFNDSSGTTNIHRYQVSAGDPDIANPGSGTTVMTYSQPYSNHNGGWLGFGPDGFLYISSGDGGSGNDPGNRAQDITSQKLGKILRIDVNGDDFPGDATRNYAIPLSNPFVGKAGDDEIWAYGLRNPWRSSFDRLTGDLYIADVGQNQREEINFQPASSTGGGNYGWRVMEGTRCNFASDPLPCNDPCFIVPIHEYTHVSAPDGGYSITGGYVYRGPIAELQGTYFFADYVTDQIWSFRFDGANKTEFINRTAELSPDVGSIDSISSFGEDAFGNLYIVDLGGEVFKIVCNPAPRGDFEGDCGVGITDFAMFALAWSTQPGDALWNPKYDISDPSDNIINFKDADVFFDEWLTGNPPSQASNPNPANGAMEVDPNADLSWAAFKATSHDVFFGTSIPPPFIGNQTDTTFDPGTMVHNSTYYWRIDAVNGWGIATGTVWGFVTIPNYLQASNPNPSDDAGISSVDADLSWTAGLGATSHDVYFGTSSTPPFIQNQSATTYDPGTMAFGTTYYWRIDEVGTSGTTTGMVWRFTILGPPL